MRDVLERSASEAYRSKEISSKRPYLMEISGGTLREALSGQGLIPSIGLNQGNCAVKEPTDLTTREQC
jgi:hypothetical protein